MSFDIKAVSGRNSSAIVAYYLRTTETGWYVTTDVLKDAQFREAMEQQITDRATELSDKLPLMRSQVKIDSITNRLKHLKVRMPKPVGGDSKAQALVHTVHKAGLSMLLERSDARTGDIFQIQLPNNTCNSADLIAKSIRDLFPKDCPMMITIHQGDNRKNLHLQGWFSERTWDAASKAWGKPLQQFRTKVGLSEFRAKVDAVLEKFGAIWAKDPDAPKRTVFHPAKSQFMKDIPRDELLKGDFLSTIENPKLRQCLTEEVDIARYYAGKYEMETKKTEFSGTALNAMIGSHEMYQTVVTQQSRSISTEFQVQSVKVTSIDEIKDALSKIPEQTIEAAPKLSVKVTSENDLRTAMNNIQPVSRRNRSL